MDKLIIAVFILVVTSCSNEQRTSNSQQVLSTSDSLTVKLDSLLSTNIFNGFSVAIVVEGGTRYSRGFGYSDRENEKPYTVETLSNIASISKMFIGISLLAAQEQGLLSLDDPISNYLPFNVENPNHPDSPITIRHLATHTSSIVDGDAYMKHDYVRIDGIPLAPSLTEDYELYYKNPPEDWLSLSDFLFALLVPKGKWYASTVYATRAPGEEYEYSNTGAALCALVIESASGQSFETFTEKNIFVPLSMSSTAWSHKKVDMSRHTKLYADSIELPKYEILSYPDGGLITSTSDLCLFLTEFIRGNSGNGTLLDPASYRALFTPQLSKEQLNGKEDYNVGLFTEMHLAHNVIGHSGGDPGVNTMMFYDTKTKTGRIMLLNSDSDKENSNEVYWGIWNALSEFKFN